MKINFMKKKQSINLISSAPFGFVKVHQSYGLACLGYVSLKPEIL